MEGQDLSLDMISSLPPSIIETILYLLPIQEAARTSVLAKKWRHKWTTIPHLVFSEHTLSVSPHRNKMLNLNLEELNVLDEIHCEINDMSSRFKLYYAIYQVLLAHQGPILSFSLTIPSDETCIEIDQIIAHLARANTLEELLLELGHGYKLPLSFFSLHKLTALHLGNCDIRHQPTFNGFGCLKILSLKNVNISKKALLHLLSKSPFLKSCGLHLIKDNILGNDKSTIVELFECLLVIKNLRILNAVIERFAQGVFPRQLPTSLDNLKYFCLEDMCFVDNYCLPFLVLLMRSSPNLKKLCLLNLPEVRDIYSDDEIDSVIPQDYSSIWLENLKELLIKNFVNMKPEVEFVKLILAKSPMLMKVRIVLDSEVASDEDLQRLATHLRHFPHASPLVEISVENDD